MVLVRVLWACGVQAVETPPPAASDRYDFALAAARDRAPSQFTFVVEAPFVIAGDEDARVVAARASETVRPVVRALREMYFPKDPDRVFTVWLFRDDESYRSHAWTFFRHRPETPYGYASEEHAALVMNIGTGGGTLVHEMVHAFLHANVDPCPTWLNEGLASLYEQVGIEEGRLVGYPNWRLVGLKRAVRTGATPSFRWLMETDADTFYNEERGVHYGQARYLLYYLQERGLLDKYWRTWTRARDVDPTGYLTLQAVLGTTDMAAFQEEWETFVMGLVGP